MPYAQIGNRFYFPTDAQLDPEISADEVRVKLLWDVQVLHPTTGLVGFSDENAVPLEALLLPPPRTPADWNWAQVGISPRPPLISVQAEALPSLQEILEAGRDDIGSEVDEQLPLLPDESPLRDAMRRTAGASIGPVLNGIVWLAAMGAVIGSKLPGRNPPASNAARPVRKVGWLAQWAAKKLNSIAQASQDHRNRELNRLMGLLETNPDEGLQFALPLRDVTTRGIARPSNILGRRSPNFDSSKLFGGNDAGDRWAIPPDFQTKLKEQYRDAANRELNLGRFSRAAYIFAHLLGDFSAAADALKRGRSFREAAAVYKDKLNDTKAAADCLVEAQLIMEAIPFYRALQMHELAGDLHERLGQINAARECYLAQVAQLNARSKFIPAAKILETKLHEPDQALELFASLWPDSNLIGPALMEWFALCGRLARHDDAVAKLMMLRDTPPLSWKTNTLVQSLCPVALNYPDSVVREKCADTVRWLAGNRLAESDPGERAALIKAIVLLVPADRLLSRDGARFLSSKIEKPAPVPIPVKGISPVIVKTFQLPGEFDYRAVVSLPGGYLALGMNARNLVMGRGAWDGRMYHEVSDFDPTKGAYSLVAPGQGTGAIVARFRPRPVQVPQFTLARIDVFQDELRVETPGYLGPVYLGICRDESGKTWVGRYDRHGDISLSTYSETDVLLSTHNTKFAINPSEPLDGPLPMAARRGSIFIGYKDHLLHFRVGRSLMVTKMPQMIRMLTPCPAHTVTRVIATFADGCALFSGGIEYRLLAQGLPNPVAAFMPDGSIVVVGERAGHVYGRKGSELTFLSSFETARQPLAVLPAVHGQFAVFDGWGKVEIYRINDG